MDEYLAPLITLQHSQLILALMIVSVLDVLLGYAKAFTLKVVDSSVGTIGIMKHILMVTVPMLIYPLFYSSELVNIWGIFVVSIIISNGISAIENWNQMGLPFPEQFKDYFANNDKKLAQTLLSQLKKERDKHEKD